MAIIQCTECSKEVAEKARNCPHCGFQLNKPQRSFIGKLILFLFVFFHIFMLFTMIGVCSSQVRDPSTSTEIVATGIMILVIIWVIGSIILGIATLVTRPK